jgi:hypothetical protein
MGERNTAVLPVEEIRKLAAESVRPEAAAQLGVVRLELLLLAAAIVVSILLMVA